MLTVALVLLLTGPAAALSLADFVATLKKQTGVSDFVLSTKRACLCRGGPLDGRLGLATVETSGPDTPAYLECTVPRFAADGHELDEAGCVDRGGVVELLTR